MKNLLTLLLLILGTAAFANNNEQTAPAPSVNNHETTIKKEGTKAVRMQETENPVKQAQKENTAKERQHKSGTAKSCTTLDKSPFSISEYFVDFVHTSNVKLVNMLLD